MLSLQHTFAMFEATELVPILTGSDSGATLFAAGIGAFLFDVVVGFKAPVFLGSSLVFILGIIAIGAGERLPYAVGVSLSQVS